jgi:hypothetical protein
MIITCFMTATAQAITDAGKTMDVVDAGQEELSPDPPAKPDMTRENPAEAAKLFDSIELETLARLKGLGVNPYIPTPSESTATADYKVALNLGVTVADALSAAVNQNKDAFQKFASQVHTYGESLGVGDAVLSKYREITVSTEKGDWANVNELIYQLKDDISEQLVQDDMHDAAILAMVSGWLEGLFIVGHSLEAHFPENAAGLLQDRTFASYLGNNLEKVDAGTLEQKEVAAILAVLPQINDILDRPLTYKYNARDAARLVELLEPIRAAIIR